MNWLIGMIVVAVAVFTAWAWDRIRKNRRSQLLDEVARTGNLQEVENLGRKLGIVLVHDIGFSRRAWWRPQLHELAWPEALGRFACSLLKAKEDDPEFWKYIRGVGVWIFDHYSHKQQVLFLQAMDRQPDIAHQVALARGSGRVKREAEDWERQHDKERKRQLRAWGVKPDTTPQDTTPQQEK